MENRQCVRKRGKIMTIFRSEKEGMRGELGMGNGELRKEGMKYE